MRQLLKNAKLYDGTGAEPYQADILLEDDRIAKIAGNIDLPADQVYDLAEKSVSSGFIDAHSHNDWFAIKKDPLPYFSPFLRQGITTFITGNCGIILLGFGFRDIQIAYIGPGYEKYEGKTVHQIAKEEGISDLKAYLMLCEKSGFVGRVNMGPYSTPEIISDFEHNEYCLYMTDAWVEDHGVQNPAIYDCYPKFLRDSLRGTGDTLPNTIRRMTGAIADRFMLPDRGYLKEGYYADLTVFDEEALKNGIPDQEKPFGIEKVFINGVPVLSESRLDESALKKTGHAIPVFG